VASCGDRIQFDKLDLVHWTLHAKTFDVGYGYFSGIGLLAFWLGGLLMSLPGREYSTKRMRIGAISRSCS